ncbi:hypothetical protein, conserved [Leishmania tarentolae]|uniref:Uncharacterized protein n=1 Tax=Leishmania tarentolae TaxID=5689 RepID=A0A640KBK9_LEITA|nr:hypothetical protein, conserved [Leishmania tarentolae]
MSGQAARTGGVRRCICVCPLSSLTIPTTSTFSSARKAPASTHTHTHTHTHIPHCNSNHCSTALWCGPLFTMPDSQTVQVFVLWNGEWPYVKRGVSEVRAVVARAIASANALVDVPAYLARARKYTAAADDFVMAQSARASSTLESHQWVVPATGIALASIYVVVRSAPWGGVKMMRNGLITAAALITFMYPREIVHQIDSAMPFQARASIDEHKTEN